MTKAGEFETASIPDAVEALRVEAEVEVECASEAALFATVPTTACDACGDPLRDVDPDPDATTGYGIPGAGVYMWTRGSEVRLESAPLCPSCASAIGMTALARWEIEEEEG